MSSSNSRCPKYRDSTSLLCPQHHLPAQHSTSRCLYKRGTTANPLILGFSPPGHLPIPRSPSPTSLSLIPSPSSPQAILTHMRVECKCHGVSGSCEVKTCWRAVPPFRQVGHALKEKFDGATEVEPRRVGSSRALVPRNAQFKPHTDEDLVYLEPSPDFCEQDIRSGVLGTRGRTCNKTSKAIDGCELLCCGRGFHTAQVELSERCGCRFHWCCFVKCRQCQRLVEMHTCR